MNRQERVDYLKSKKTFNIWRIKNRWLRAGVAWVVVIGIAAFLAFAFAVTAIIGAIRGLWEGPVEFIDGFDEWRDLGGNAWAAMTAKDAP